MGCHKDLIVWAKGVDFVTKNYKITRSFPEEERYGLISQIRRGAVSIPSNISEGAARAHKREFIQFLYISLGSIAELETQFIICENLSYISTSECTIIQNELTELRKMTIGLINHLKSRNK